MIMFKPAALLALAFFLPWSAFAQQTSTARPAITGISHITLYADNMPKSQQFYQSLLGWDMLPATEAKSSVRFYANHLQYVELVSPPQQGLEDRLISVAFATSDADALRRFLGAHGVSVPDAVTVEHDGSRSFPVHDPEGNKVEFTQAIIRLRSRDPHRSG
jgi:catechol 2,3-dioxygenase-like lactoylglutathione lyase family enzyme